MRNPSGILKRFAWMEVPFPFTFFDPLNMDHEFFIWTGLGKEV